MRTNGQQLKLLKREQSMKKFKKSAEEGGLYWEWI